MAKEKKFIFLNSQIYESVEVQEGNSTFYEGIYKREWYEESFTEFWIPFLKNLKENTEKFLVLFSIILCLQ